MMKGHFPEEWISREGKDLVFVEGNLGSTKSSFLHVLGEGNRSWEVFKEPTCLLRNFPFNRMVRNYESTEDFFRQIPSGRAGNLLEKIYYGGVPIHTFQSMLMNCYLDKVSKELINKQMNLAFERTPFSCQFFFTEYHKLKGTIDELQGTILDRQFATASEILHKNWEDRRVTFVYLKEEAPVCLERVRVRGRPEENQVKIDFLESLSILHNNFFDTMMFQQTYGYIQIDLGQYKEDGVINHKQMMGDLLSILSR
jgi:deoxyadenosine/deoxycytidine kinase